MQKLTKSSLVVATLVGVALYGWWRTSSDEVQEDPSGIAIEKSGETPSSHLATAASNEAGNTSLKPGALQLQNNASTPVYSADSIYATLVQLHAAKIPGSWGALHQLIVACVSADLSIDAAKAELSTPEAMASAQYSLRTEALRKLETKCEKPPSVDYIAQFQPRDDDEEGKKFMAASNALRDRKPGYRFRDVEAAVRELARQGRLDVAARFLSLDRRVAGREWAGDDESFSAAVNAAIELATAERGREHDDIRLLEKCARFGRCDFQYGTLVESVSAKDRESAMLLAAKLAQRMRNGEVNELFGSKG